MIFRSSAVAPPGSAQPPRFDRIARLYRWAEYLALGPLLTFTREQYLSCLSGSRQALLLGDGDGRFTATLLHAVPELQALAVDGSRTMLRLLKTRCAQDGNASRLTILHAAVSSAPIPAGTDLIATHFLLDCLTQSELNALACRLAANVRPGCLWVISEFGYPRHRLGRFLAGVYLRLLYAVFRVLTGLVPQHLPDPERALRSAGFRRLRRRERIGGFLYSELWQLPALDLQSPHRTQDATSVPAGTSTQR